MRSDYRIVFEQKVVQITLQSYLNHFSTQYQSNLKYKKK